MSKHKKIKLADQKRFIKLANDGNESYSKHNFQEAETLYRQALAIYNDPSLIYNIGLCQYSKYQYQQALDTFKKIRMYKPDTGLGLNEQSLCELHLGNTKEGLKLYKHRVLGGSVQFPDLPLPFISDNIDDLKDKNVLILNEQGLGDELMFARCIEAICNIAKSVTWQIYDNNYRLFSNNIQFENLTLFTDRSLSYQFVSSFDCWSSSGTIFSILNEHIQSPPIKFNVEPILPKTEKTKIGFIFETNKESPNYHERSVPKDIFKSFLTFEDKIELYNLQKDIQVDFAINILKDVNDTLDTAKIFSSMNYIITVDTFGVHLAASLGIRTHLLYDKYLDWRWKNNLYTNVMLINLKEFAVTSLE